MVLLLILGYLIFWTISTIILKNKDKSVEIAINALQLDDSSLQIIDEETINGIMSFYRELFYTIKRLSSLEKFVLFRKSRFKEFIDLYDQYLGKVSLINKRATIYQNERNAVLKAILDELPKAFEDYWKYIPNNYLTHSAQERLTKRYAKLRDNILLIEKYNLREQVDIEKCQTMLGYLSDRRSYNTTYIKQELDRCSDYFDSVLQYPFDAQQRNSIVIDEDNNLVISSAGSGKTSIIIGKTRYLTEQKGVDPEKILVISYTKKAASELKARLNNPKITCCTFHKLAMDIVANHTQHKPSIADSEILIHKIYGELIRNDSFKSAVIDYISYVNNPTEFDADDPEEHFKSRRKCGTLSVLPDMDGRRIYTKSNEEKAICFFLSSWDLQFRYEENYEKKTSTPEHSQYKPDFSIHYKDKKGHQRRLYLEHYALNAKGKVPKWFAHKEIRETWEQANNKYHDEIKWKEETHSKNNTQLITTKSEYFQNGTIKTILKRLLIENGVPIREVPKSELYQRIKAFEANKNIENMVLKMVQSFISLMKCGEKSINNLLFRPIDLHATDTTRIRDERNEMIVSSIIKPIYEAYCKQLQIEGKIDFSDLIKQATKICNNNISEKRYDYILIDEFQDISIDRYKFIQSLRKFDMKTKLFCVGDDWQSIYRFAGSDMALFYQFSKYFGYTEESKIETTYRFGEPTISISSKFIKANPNQKRKSVKGNKRATDIQFKKFDASRGGQEEALIEVLQSINNEESVLIIGRYSFDVDMLCNSRLKKVGSSDGKVYIMYARKKYQYLTIHQAKGLEADNAILINCSDGSGSYGFPSLVEDDPVLNLVLSESDHYTFAEERRLFYVAITRAKNHTYILYNKEHPSQFIIEVGGCKTKGKQLCPRCKCGYIECYKEGVASNGTPYRNYHCTNAASGCDYHNRVFENRERIFK